MRFGLSAIAFGRYLVLDIGCGQREVANAEPRRQDRMEAGARRVLTSAFARHIATLPRVSPNRIVLIDAAHDADAVRGRDFGKSSSRFPNLQR